jgi:uncharacterized Zn finger protein
VVTVVVSEESVQQLAGSCAYERGHACFLEGRVGGLAVEGTAVLATVDDGRRYRVRLDLRRSGLAGECDCPPGVEGLFCEHCVATALAWLDSDGTSAAPVSEPAAITDAELGEFLREQDRAWLAEQLMRAAAADPLLRARLEVAAGAEQGYGLP